VLDKISFVYIHILCVRVVQRNYIHSTVVGYAGAYVRIYNNTYIAVCNSTKGDKNKQGVKTETYSQV